MASTVESITQYPTLGRASQPIRRIRVVIVADDSDGSVDDVELPGVGGQLLELEGYDGDTPGTPGWSATALDADGSASVYLYPDRPRTLRVTGNSVPSADLIVELRFATNVVG